MAIAGFVDLIRFGRRNHGLRHRRGFIEHKATSPANAETSILAHPLAWHDVRLANMVNVRSLSNWRRSYAQT
jgi:hypothetical protein